MVQQKAEITTDMLYLQHVRVVAILHPSLRLVGWAEFILFPRDGRRFNVMPRTLNHLQRDLRLPGLGVPQLGHTSRMQLLRYSITSLAA